MKQILTAFARNRVFANIMLVLIFFCGIVAANSMIREFFPEFSLDMIAITVPYPGADPEEVEEGISRRIEEAVEGLEGVKQFTTKSSENLATANIEVKEGYEVSDVLDRVRSKVNAISTFPVDTEEPIITEITLKDVVISMYLSGEMDERRLKEWAERLKDNLQSLPEISQVRVAGIRDYEIGIEISEERLREYNLTFDQVSRAVRRSSINLGGGVIRTQGEEIRVRTMERKYTGAELSKIVVVSRPGGEIITLDRLATVVDGFSEDPIQASVNRKPALLVLVSKTKEEDSLAISKAVHRFVDAYQPQLPQGAKVNILFDTTGMLQARIDLMLKNGIIGLCVVFLLLWMFLNARLSFWSGMGIPISIAGAMAILWAVGGTINMISLFGFIMVLGIVVDDAIIVGEAIFVHRQQGKTGLQAAVDGVREVGLPVLAAVVTSVVAFVPLGFIGGIMGKFIAILPVVVIACLAVSLIECLFLLPAHLNHLPGPERLKTKRGFIYRLEAINRLTSRAMDAFVEKVYAPFLKRAVNWRYVSLCTAVAILMVVLGSVLGGLIKFEVFPAVDGFIITSTVEFPAGTPPETTRQAIRRIEEGLLEISAETNTVSDQPLLEDYLTLVGYTLQEIPKYGPHVGSVQAILLESELRGVHSEDIMVAWEKAVGTIPGVKALTFEGMAAGPPGAPIEVWLQGNEMDSILAASELLMERLREFDGVYQIRSDFAPGKNELRFNLKPEARALGLTVDDLARQLYAGYYGDEAFRLQRGRDDVRVRIRYPQAERQRVADLEQIRIRTTSGIEVPLLSVADVQMAPGYSTITRTDGLRRVAVSANVDSHRANASEIFAELGKTTFPKLKERFPGLQVSLQGEKKKMSESFSSLYVGFPLAVLGIFIIVATIFRSYAQPFVILFTIPFGIIGAIAGHMVFGYTLSMMSIFGMVALTGVVVNDAIVLIERINENLADGLPFFEAIHKGGLRRFRPIFLTSLSTVGGLAPMIMETDFQAKFLVPMALSLAAGVLFATVLTLVLIPSLLVILNDFRRLSFWLRKGYWPHREAVEPARTRRAGLVGRDSESHIPELGRGARAADPRAELAQTGGQR